MSITEIVVGVVILTVVVGVVVWVIRESKSSSGMSRIYGEQNKKKAEREALGRILTQTNDLFGVELSKINEDATRDEIVRLVNLLAHEASVACEKQDKDRRRGSCADSTNDDAHRTKRKWSESRNFALQIAPELADRLPHFSEFEPLKSYNAEHLLKKAEKKRSS